MISAPETQRYHYIALPIERHHVERDLSVRIPFLGKVNHREQPLLRRVG